MVNKSELHRNLLNLCFLRTIVVNSIEFSTRIQREIELKILNYGLLQSHWNYERARKTLNGFDIND